MSIIPTLLWLAVACGNQTPTPSSSATGIEVLSADRLRSHVEVLASDTYNGRETLQEGARMAASYMSTQFQELGLQPLPGQDDFRVPYTLYQSEIHASLSTPVGEHIRGADFRVFPFSDEGEADAEVVFAGYGISAPKLGYDDYAHLDVEGKIVLVLRHVPNENLPDAAISASDRHGLFLTKAVTAAERGALGMVLVTDPNNHEPEEDFRSGRLTAEPPKKSETMARGPKFLAMHISRRIAEGLVAPSGKTLSELQSALDTGESVQGPLDGITAKIAIQREVEPKAVEAINVIGYLEGQDPDEWVVVGAHYDHLGGFSGHGDTVYNGADDNASGTAGVLELARAFSTLPQPKRSLVFVGFSGEEKGLLGSSQAVANGTLEPTKIRFMLNLDMIGRDDAGTVELVGDGFATDIGPLAEAAATGVSLPFTLGGDSYAGNSDHHPFYKAGVPFLFFFTGLHDDYHQLSDHADKLSYEQMEAIVRAGMSILGPIASGEVTPVFIHHFGWLGAKIRGGQVIGLESDGRGATAGLEEGDVIVDFSAAQFREIEPGTTTTLRISRGDQHLDVEVERAKTGYLGVYPGMLPEGFAKKHGLLEDEGLMLNEIAPGTPAAEAELQDGDVLIRIAGSPIGLRTLGRTLTRIGAGEKVHIVIIRDGERLEKTLILGERPERP